MGLRRKDVIFQQSMKVDVRVSESSLPTPCLKAGLRQIKLQATQGLHGKNFAGCGVLESEKSGPNSSPFSSPLQSVAFIRANFAEVWRILFMASTCCMPASQMLSYGLRCSPLNLNVRKTSVLVFPRRAVDVRPIRHTWFELGQKQFTIG